MTPASGYNALQSLIIKWTNITSGCALHCHKIMTVNQLRGNLLQGNAKLSGN